jgi:hypothetical protein
MNMLQEIASSRLPITFHRNEDIDRVRVLRAAGLVVALVPAPSDPIALGGSPTAAQVLAVTQKGREELARFGYPQRRTSSWRLPRIKTLASAPEHPAGAPTAAGAAQQSRGRSGWVQRWRT